MKRVAERGGLQETSEPATARRIGLQDVDRAGFEHAAEIIDVIAVLAGGNFHSGRGAFANKSQPLEIVRGNWFLEPGDVELGERAGLRERLFARIGAIRIDEKIDIVADRIARRAHPLNVAANWFG